MVKIEIGCTIAIGDGENDVGILQEAYFGIGINGIEGMQVNMKYPTYNQNSFVFQYLLINIILKFFVLFTS